MESKENSKRNKFIEELNKLKDELAVIEALPERVKEEYYYNLTKLHNKIGNYNKDEERTYIIHSQGFIKDDGYEKYYIYVFGGSYIKFSVSDGEKAFIQLVDSNGNTKLFDVLMDGMTSDMTAAEDMLFKVYKYKRKDEK